MRKPAWSLLVLPFLSLPAGAAGQTPMVATYITAEQVQEVNAFPGTDRQIISRDISGGGTLVTGGEIMNGRRGAPDSRGTLVLNGPSCSGNIVGDVQSKDVKGGDIIIIPAGVPHGWSNIPDHVDYLSVRPDPDRVIADYVHPEIELPLYPG